MPSFLEKLTQDKLSQASEFRRQTRSMQDSALSSVLSGQKADFLASQADKRKTKSKKADAKQKAEDKSVDQIVKSFHKARTNRKKSASDWGFYNSIVSLDDDDPYKKAAISRDPTISMWKPEADGYVPNKTEDMKNGQTMGFTLSGKKIPRGKTYGESHLVSDEAAALWQELADKTPDKSKFLTRKKIVDERTGLSVEQGMETLRNLVTRARETAQLKSNYDLEMSAYDTVTDNIEHRFSSLAAQAKADGDKKLEDKYTETRNSKAVSRANGRAMLVNRHKVIANELISRQSGIETKSKVKAVRDAKENGFTPREGTRKPKAKTHPIKQIGQAMADGFNQQSAAPSSDPFAGIDISKLDEQAQLAVKYVNENPDADDAPAITQEILRRARNAPR